MRTHGTLTKWNDARGFGFISPAQGNEEVFVHITAFPRDGVRPTLNELVSYETESGKDGKRRAIRIMRAERRHPPRHASEPRRGERGAGRFAATLGILVVIAAGAYQYSRSPMKTAESWDTHATIVIPETPEITSSYTCDGRVWCSEMTSCEEARYFVQHCPGTKMDGDGDGNPCEQQWCN